MDSLIQQYYVLVLIRGQDRFWYLFEVSGYCTFSYHFSDDLIYFISQYAGPRHCLMCARVRRRNIQCRV